MSINKDLLEFLNKKYGVPAEDKIALLQNEIFSSELSTLDFLLEKKFLSEHDLYMVFSEFFNIEYEDFELIEKNKALISEVNLSTMLSYGIVPIRKGEDSSLTVAITDPMDIFNRTALNDLYPGEKRYVLCAKSAVFHYLNSLRASTSTNRAISEFTMDAQSVKTAAENERNTDEEINAPAVRLAESIIQEALIQNASDIHIEPFEKTVRVRNRVDGTLFETTHFSPEIYLGVKARLKIIAGLNIAESRIPQDGRVKYVFNGEEIDFRVSTMPTAFGEKFVIRILDKHTFSFKRKDLAFSPQDNRKIDSMITAPHGIILITGPTGSGKSTTMYSFLSEMNDIGINISTVEDPIEYTIDGINQTQVNPKAGLTFATVLRSFLRQDPNVMMVGEIRDEETAQIAVRAAITGHLVLSTLHTNDAPGAIVRLMDMGIRPYLLADSLVGITAQRLVKRLCPHCREPYTSTPSEMRALGIAEPATIYRAVGCPYCNGHGYRGRIAVQEVLLISEDLRMMISKDVSLEEIRAVAEKDGMTPLYKSCCDYVLKGVTTMTELDSLATNIQMMTKDEIK